MSYEKEIFSTDARYKVKQNLTSGLSQFHLNEILIFSRCDYSPYDNCFLYIFNTKDGESKIWWLHEDQPSEVWHQYFEAISHP